MRYGRKSVCDFVSESVCVCVRERERERERAREKYSGSKKCKTQWSKLTRKKLERPQTKK